MTTVQVSYVCKDTFPSFSLVGVDVSIILACASKVSCYRLTCVYALIDLDVESQTGEGSLNEDAQLEK